MHILDKSHIEYIPLYESTISAGFPSPSEGYIEGRLDLNEYLVSNPPATFFMKANSDAMIGVGIFPGDLLIVDRSKKAINGKVVIASINGELIVRRFFRSRGEGKYNSHNTNIILRPENKKYTNIVINDAEELVVWGIVMFALHGL